MKKLSKDRVFTYGNDFLKCNDLHQICRVVDVDENRVKLYSIHKKYIEFKVPKQDGYREIEMPEKNLMQLLRRFNLYLQSAYYIHQTPVAYGFIINVSRETHPKNILENARKHLGHKYMMKLDFKDFFHQITKQQLFKMFKAPPFLFNKKTAQILANLFTYKDRLPMGAPTSPVLSNFVCIDLDNELQQWAKERQISFTRFADDLTFSTGLEKFSETHLKQVTDICLKHQLKLNEHKTVFYDENDVKEVTGLILHKTVDIPREFYNELNDDIRRLKSLVEAGFIVKHHFEDDVFLKFKQEVKGKINFIGMIEGYNSKVFYRYNKKFKKALEPPGKEILYARWTHFNYF